MNLSYELIKHVKRNLSLSAILTAKDTYGMIYIIVDYRVGKFPFSVNKCNVTDTLWLHGASEISEFSTGATH